MRKMTKTGRRRSRGVHVGTEESGEVGPVMQQGSTQVVLRWETVGRRTTGEKGNETEMATEEGSVEREEKVGRVQLD